MAKLFWPARPALADRLAAASETAQRAVARTLAERAVRLAAVARGDEALAYVRAGQHGDSELRRWLEGESSAAELRSQQADERGDTAAGEREFAFARAAAVLAFALDLEAEEASQGAAYESWSLGVRAEVEQIIESTLANS